MKTAIVVAAGEGRRMGSAGPSGSNRPKQFLTVGGKPIVVWSLEAFNQSKIDEIILVVPSGWIRFAEALKRDHLLSKPVKIVAGGATRQNSAFHGVQACAPATEFVAVHDGCRPLVTAELINNCLTRLEDADGVCVGVPAGDTLKRVSSGVVKETVERRGIWRAQTPQVFKYPVLVDAYEKARVDGFQGTDEASLVERLGGRVDMLPGPSENIKVTTPGDIELAAALLRSRTRR